MIKKILFGSILCCTTFGVLSFSAPVQAAFQPLAPLPHTRSTPVAMQVQAQPHAQLVSGTLLAASDNSELLNEAGGAWDSLKKSSKDMWDAAKETTGDVWEETKDTTKDVWEETKNTTKDVWEETKDTTQRAWGATREEREQWSKELIRQWAK